MIKQKQNFYKLKSKKEEQEFGPGKKNIVMCPDCNAVYYYKSWHHDFKKVGKNFKFVLCPACKMIKNKQFEGQVIIENIEKNKKQELINLIKNIGKRAFDRDVLDRIIKINEITSDKIEVLTTENQLAVSIAKQVKKAFKAELEIKWSKDESVVRILVKM